MSNEEVTTVAADYMYLVILGDSDIIDDIATAMNENAHNKDSNKLYVSTDIDKQVDYLPETEEFQRLLEMSIDSAREECLTDDQQSSLDQESDEKTDGTSYRKYYVMGEGVETAQCYTCGEGYTNASMLIEIEERDEFFNILFPILSLDDEVNPEDLITSWVIDNNIAHVAGNLSIRLVNMVGTTHDILVFAAYVNRSIRN